MVKTEAFFAKAPVREAVFEVRFPLSLAIKSNPAALHNRISEEFTVMELQTELGNNGVQEKYRFSAADGREKIFMSFENFAYASYDYQGFQAFAERFNRVFQYFTAAYAISDFVRVGLRYVNLLPTEQAEGIKLQDYVDISVGLPEKLSAYKLETVQASVFLSSADLRLRASTGLRANPSPPVVVLDLDCFREGKVPNEEVPRLLPVAHDFLKKVFLALLSPSYLQKARSGGA